MGEPNYIEIDFECSKCKKNIIRWDFIDLKGNILKTIMACKCKKIKEKNND